MYLSVFKSFSHGIERSAKKVSRVTAKSNRKTIDYLFDKQIKPLTEKIDYIAKKRIEQAANSAEFLEAQFVEDIQVLIDQADQRVQANLIAINKIREDALEDLRETIDEADFYLENRINQITLVVMQALNDTQKITTDTLVELNSLEEKIFQDANEIIDLIDEIIDGKLELIRNELRKYLVHALPNPFDACRRKLKIACKPGSMLSDIEIYELTKCYELSKINENQPVEEILKVYGQIQQNAAMMAALVKKSPELKRRAVEDWIKYGLMCDFWRNTQTTYDNAYNWGNLHDTPLLTGQSSYKLLTGDK